MAGALVVTALYALAPGAASAGARRRAVQTPTDRAALHMYFLDTYGYAQAVARAAPAIVGAYEAAANRLAGQCPGVLAGAPQEEELLVGPSAPRRTARQRGEEKRHSTQLSDLDEELASALDSAEQEARRPAELALLAKLKALPRGEPALSRVVHAQISGLEEDLKVQSADVCADMRAWAGSGYRTLSPASRAIALQREAELASVLRDLAADSASVTTSLPETSADRALVLKTLELELHQAKAISGSIASARRRVEAALGLTARAKREERLKLFSHESKSSTKLGSGRTAAGTRYTVWLQRTKGGPAGMCKASVEVRKTEQANPVISELIIEGGSEVCLAPRQKRSEEPDVSCSEGLLKIESEVPSATRTVDLRMSDDAQVVSRPLLVPRRLGGPAAFYYQAVRGPSPVPVSLTERDAQGRTLRMLKLRRIVGCTRHPVKYVRGGRLTLVHGSTPQGPSFSIVGERYRLFGHLHAQLKLITGEASTPSGEGEEEDIEQATSGSVPIPTRRMTPLDSEISAGCHPHQYSILYGLLRQPRDTVLAKIGGRLVPVSRVRLPSSLHAAGVLVYLASVGQPEEILVRSPDGTIVAREDLGRAASEGREACEGESEGVGPPPGGFGGIGETRTIVLSG